MKKIKDRIILGMVSGILSSMPPQVVDALAYKSGLADLSYAQLAAKLFIPKNKTATPQGKFLSFLINSINGGLVGVFTTYLLSLTGRDKAVIKGIGAGTMLWVLVNGLLSHVGLKITSKKPLTPILSFFNHVLSGTLNGILILKLGDDSLFPNSSIRKEKMPVFYTGSTEQTSENNPMEDQRQRA